MTNSPQPFNTELTKDFVPSLPSVEVNVKCPNQFPLYAKTEKKIAIVGGTPNRDDLNAQQPFSGSAGSLLFNSLRRYGINRAECYVGNVCQTPLPDKYKTPFSMPEVIEGNASLRGDIIRYTPNIVLLADQLALAAAFPTKKKSITDWRGSLLIGDSDGICPGVKCLPCLHPSAVFKDWSQWPLFTFDIERFAHETSTSILNLPSRSFDLDIPAHRAISLLKSITGINSPIALDIEGGVGGMSCVSFARSPEEAFIVPLATYNDYDKQLVLRQLSAFLSSTTPKILQNQLYDNFVLSWTYKTPIQNVIWDTMLSGWEIYPELPKGLGTQVSIWTREPFYKMDRKSEDTRRLHEYCCKDSACTYEIYLAHRTNLLSNPKGKKHFHFNMALLPALLYMEQRGINYDSTTAGLELQTTGLNLRVLQDKIDNHILAMWEKYGQRGDRPSSVNINSPKQLAIILYDRLGYPKQHPKKGRELDRTKVTTNVDALLELRKKYNGENDLILEHILQWRKQDGLRETLELKTDSDGRMRCGYNIVGTETGRLTCYGSPTGSGANLTTITKSLRKLYTADKDHWFFQCDLSGADGWTVAAHCALRGDTTMLDDYIYGLKPARIIALMMRVGKVVNTWSREKLKEECKAVTEDDPILGWQYFACKRVQHGTNYGLGRDKMSLQILKDSYKLLGKCHIVSPSECVIMQDLYLARYPGVKFWQASCKQQIDTTSTMECASGHTRKFFGRKGDHSTYMEAFAHEPQANTTYATNLALFKLWTDPLNRLDAGSRTNQQGVNDAYSNTNESNQTVRGRLPAFKVEPLHHVHDALCGQFRKSDTSWAIARIRTYFDNPLVIAGRTITIPFEGAFGPNWKNLGNNCYNGHPLKEGQLICTEDKCGAPATGGGKI